MIPSDATPAANPTESLLRQCFLGLGAFAALGIVVELAIARHWTSRVQLIPWVSVAVVLAAIAMVARRTSRQTILGARAAAAAVFLASGYGVLDHAMANHHVAPLDAAFSDRWDSMSWLAQWWAAISGAVGPAPTFAPGALALSAAALIAFTLRHPVLGGAPSRFNAAAVRQVARSGLTAVLLVFVALGWVAIWAIGELRALLGSSRAMRRVAVGLVFLAGIGFSQWVLAQGGDAPQRIVPSTPAATVDVATPTSPAPPATRTAPATPPVPPADAAPSAPVPAATTPTQPPPPAVQPPTQPQPAPPATRRAPVPPKRPPKRPPPVRRTPTPPPAVPSQPPPTTTSDDDDHGRGRGRGRGGRDGGDDDDD